MTITLLSFYYPRGLIKHLIKERKLTVGKSAPGIYYINNETFFIQIIVTKELYEKENLYLRFMDNHLQDNNLINRFIDEYNKHKGQEIYMKYFNQILNANNNTKKEDSPIVCEALFNIFGTTSQEFYDRGKQESEDYYLPKINELQESNETLSLSIEQLSSSNEQLSSSNKKLSSQIDFLKELLKQHNIPFDLESVANLDANQNI